ncbi:MAG: NusG domain II-containing protein [Candidatus Omnitrophica bacterium]|nr:NusG domain II-containing protein [Candidatus Omnitrophota bacterium]
MAKNYRLGDPNFYKISKLDVIVISLILLIAVYSMIWTSIQRQKSQGKKQAVIYLENNFLDKVILDKDKNIAILDGRMQAEVKMGKIRILTSDCAQKICVGTGFIQYVGQVIVCVPNKVLIEIKSEKKPFLDAVVY